MTDMVDFNSPDFLDELSWKSEYDIGDELIDSSHRRLFAVLRRVLMILQDGDSARNRNICRTPYQKHESSISRCQSCRLQVQ